MALSNGQVLMLDVPRRQVVTSFAVGGMPRFIITGTYLPAANPAPGTVQKAPSSVAMLSTGSLLLVILMVLSGLLVLSALWLFWRHYQKGTTHG